MLDATPLWALTQSQAAKETIDTSSSIPHLDPLLETSLLEVSMLPKTILVRPSHYDFRRSLPQPTVKGNSFSVINELHIVATGMSIMDVLRSCLK